MRIIALPFPGKMLTKLLALALLCPALAHAQEASVRVQITPTVEYDSRQTTFHDGGSMRCHPEWSGGRSEPFEPLRQKAESSENFELLQSDVRTISLSGNVYGKGHYDLRRLRFQTDIQQPIDPYAARYFRLNISDWTFDTIDGDDSFDCGHTRYSALFARSILNGEISFAYKMPKGVWVVKVRQDSSDHLSLVKEDAVIGALRVGRGLKPNEILVWAKPGSTLEFKYRFHDFAPGKSVKGDARLGIQPLIESTLPDQMYSGIGKMISIQDAPEALAASAKLNTKNDAVFLALNAPMTNEEKLLALLSRIVASKTVREQMIKANRTEALNDFISRDLASFVYGAEAEALSADIKAMASFAAYALSVDLLRDTAPYCSMTDVETPVAGRTISVRGVKLAWYYLSQAYARIKYYNFENYRAIFSEIAAYERTGLTYSEVMRDPTKRSNLQRAYKALTAMDLSKMPFSAALTDVQFILKKFKTVASSETDMNRILADLTSLAKEERPFVRATMDRFMQFNESNQEKVVIADLIQKLDSIVARQDRVQSDLKDRVRFLSFDESSVSELASFLSQLITRNIEILQTPLSIKDVVQVDFDKLREAFITENNVDPLISTVQECMR
jgi:hypothetical protein